MKNTGNLGPKARDTLFAQTTEIFQGLGPDSHKNADAIVSGALSVIGGLFSVYLETSGGPPIVRFGSKLPPGLAQSLGREASCLTAHPPKKQIFIHEDLSGTPIPQDSVINRYGIKALIGAVVMTDHRPSGILWVADANPREFTSAHITAIQCLAGVLGCQAGLKTTEKDRQISEMAGKVAHDLNNILSGLVSYPELMLMQLEGTNPLREQISFIHESGLLASDMVQDFLFLARSRNYTPPLIDPRPVADAYFSGSAHGLLKQACPHVGFSLQAEDTPRVKISELFLTKIITTLLAHSAHGALPGARIHLRLTPHHPDTQDPTTSGGLRLCVEDDGPPVSRKDLDHLFTPFYTREKMGRPGSGLGLAVIKKIVNDHGGKIRIGRKTGKGNFMDILFPEIPDEDSES